MFQRLGERLRRFFAGRYGSDQLNRALVIAALVLMLLGWLGGKFITKYLEIFTVLAYAPLIWSLVRMYSRNFAKRQRENAAYLRLLTRLKDRSHRYYRCPNCRQAVRVPRGKGKISIRCPKCGTAFIRKS